MYLGELTNKLHYKMVTNYVIIDTSSDEPGKYMK